jgi:hypothetical protein
MSTLETMFLTLTQTQQRLQWIQIQMMEASLMASKTPTKMDESMMANVTQTTQRTMLRLAIAKKTGPVKANSFYLVVVAQHSPQDKAVFG